MPLKHPTPGAKATAAAASGEQEAGSPPPAPAEETPGPAAVPETEPGTSPAGENAATPDQAAAGAAEAPEEGVAVATAVATAPATKTGTGVDGGRPRTPILAGAAILGAALIAIPLLLVGNANDERDDGAKGSTTEGADTVLSMDSAPAVPEDYKTAKPSPSPTRKKPEKTETPKAAAPVPVVPTAEPSPSRTAAKKPAPEPKPKSSPKPASQAASQPDWKTVTISAPSIIDVNQAWSTNRIRMVMQPDGNLVVLNEHDKPVWASMTFGSNHRAIFQSDGNLVIHNGDDRPIWASKTHMYPGAQLVLRADGKVVIEHNGQVVWST
ncbi:mannose-binding protein [Streptomyces tsukubensis]|uniref:Mannose-binding protein n=1 Tax=Streptomyces tsukubensis TaxID=83656 RepID=A0A1V4A7Z5_9ACTN|nr:mannose-binding protein [Streptomyces tsukubensis]OON78069.1 mannose-binding protein [Streptomyces tsukubensis]QFR97235.1 mannose-binding protein [Streptomyces tsukubensis]